jgi:phosphoribosylamine--glycine ligase
MGAYSPTPLATPELAERVMREIIGPTLTGMASRGTPFRGVLFAGLMLGRDGPKLIEFNVRFGDPEAEVILARFRGDLLEWLWGAATGRLPPGVPEFAKEAALTVVIAARGYPVAPEKGAPIGGLAEAADVEGVCVLHAGTRRVGEAIVADGGRVLAVTAVGSDLAEARSRAYAAAERISLSGGFYRRDIASRALARAKSG